MPEQPGYARSGVRRLVAPFLLVHTQYSGVHRVSPRPYQLGRRQDQIAEGRRRVLEAARAELAEASTYTAFTVDAVARRADVSRATIYYQFGSKTGLLEALCDVLAASGRMSDLAGAFGAPDPGQALRAFVASFCTFWAADRPVMRRLRALAALDGEVGAVIAARDERRRAGLEVLLRRIRREQFDGDRARAVTILHMLTSFETFEGLAQPGRELEDVTHDILQLATAVFSDGRF